MASDDANALFYRHLWPLRETVLRTATFLCRDGHEAEDLAQETMLKAFRAIGQFDVTSNAQAWLLTILRNTRIDRLRTPASRSPMVSLEASDVDVAETRSEDEPRTAEELADVARLIEGFSDATMIAALRRMPEDLRWTLLLADVEGLDYTQAAEILDVPVGTVKSRVHRGRRVLKAELLKESRPARRG
jgi:RNA polymerase sigma-70 factor (ECF subfamily)